MLPDQPVKPGAPPVDERDAPIEVYFGSPSLDFGAATLPRMLPRFWVYLASDGEQLADWEYAVLVQVLTLRETQDYELRAANLPVRSKLSSIERVKAKLRRMGLVFTQRLYYPNVPGQMPKMYAQRWDMRPLFYNLEIIARLWLARQGQLVSAWNAGGRRGARPVYNFEPDFIHEVQLPPDVALDILREVFYPIPEHWQAKALDLVANLPTAHEMRGTMPTAHETRGTPTAHYMRGTAPTAHEMRGHLLEDEEEEEEEGAPTLQKRVFSHFSIRKGDPDYQPTAKEQTALRRLVADGFGVEQILAGIETTFDRPHKPRFFTHCAAITRDLARRQQESPTPETRTQPEARPVALTPAEMSQSEAVQEEIPADEPPGEPPLVIDAHLARAVEVYRSADRDVTPDLLGRFRLMAARCDATARAAGSSGGDWLADALATGLGVARPGSLLNYADAVLKDWVQNGRAKAERSQPGAGRSRKAKPAEPGVNQGILDFLRENGVSEHGGFDDDTTV